MYLPGVCTIRARPILLSGSLTTANDGGRSDNGFLVEMKAGISSTLTFGDLKCR